MLMITSTSIDLRRSLTDADSSGFPLPGLDDLRILVLDNYDSFTYNLVQYLSEISGAEIRVFRNDQITVKGVREEAPTHLVISPGPCTPNEAGISLDAVHFMAGYCPILGVCLGHQSIGQVYGGTVIRGEAPVHGKTSLIHHDGRTVFAGLPDPFVATRYHSLILHPDLPPILERSAWTIDGVVMGVRHREYVVEGVQFHPESLLTAVGKDLLCNFLRRREARWEDVQPALAAATHAAGGVCSGSRQIVKSTVGEVGEAACIDKVSIGFMLASVYHPSMSKMTPVRRAGRCRAPQRRCGSVCRQRRTKHRGGSRGSRRGIAAPYAGRRVTRARVVDTGLWRR